MHLQMKKYIIVALKMGRVLCRKLYELFVMRTFCNNVYIQLPYLLFTPIVHYYCSLLLLTT